MSFSPDQLLPDVITTIFIVVEIGFKDIGKEKETEYKEEYKKFNEDDNP
jgi:hypothetical protein